jgi:hypothetical protein
VDAIFALPGDDVSVLRFHDETLAMPLSNDSDKTTGAGDGGGVVVRLPYETARLFEGAVTSLHAARNTAATGRKYFAFMANSYT